MLANEKGGQLPLLDSEKRALVVSNAAIATSISTATKGGAPTQELLLNSNQDNEKVKRKNSYNNKFNWQQQKGAAAASQNEFDDDKQQQERKLKQTNRGGINFFDSQSQNSLKFYPPTTLQRNKRQETNNNNEDEEQNDDEKRKFLNRNNHTSQQNNRTSKQIKLAKQESLLSEIEIGDEEQEEEGEQEERRFKKDKKRHLEEGKCSWLSPLTCCICCCSCFQCPKKKEELELKKEEREKMFCLHQYWLCPILLVLIYSVAIYCLPFVNINPGITRPLPNIPFNFNDGPLRPSTASQFKAEQLFRNQISGAESMAFDSHGNAYLAIEGGFILYAHLNKSSPFKSQYLISNQRQQQQLIQSQQLIIPNLLKIAELNGVKQVSNKQTTSSSPSPLFRNQRTSDSQTINSQAFYYQDSNSIWRRECQLDEQLYGQQLYSPTNSELLLALQQQQQQQFNSKNNNLDFKSNVKVSRCSKPLGTRLSPDEAYLYVVDTLSGLYKVHLKVTERAYSNQRLVTRLIDFRSNNWQQTLPTIQLDTFNIAEQQQQSIKITRLMNVSLKAVDDITIDYGAGTKSGDLIYLTVASQQWIAVGFIYDLLEGRPSGLIARFDTGNNQLVILEPNQLAHVRTSGYGLINNNFHHDDNQQQQVDNHTNEYIDISYGVPNLNENDVFDDRPLNFPNGLELMDDKQALLIVDTSNKRIIKHYIRGPRRGTSDLWAYTPNFVDNIRRGYDKRYETYWVVGCGKAHKSSPASSSSSSSESIFNGRNNNNNNNNEATVAPVRPEREKDFFDLVRNWPMVKKFLVKNVYFFGWFIENIGQHILMSDEIRDFGYELKTGSSLCEKGCAGMFIMQFNQNGDLIRSIHSTEFPNDLRYYSQVNEFIDAQNEQHLLYLSSPSYNYVTKLILPTESYASTANLPSFPSNNQQQFLSAENTIDVR